MEGKKVTLTQVRSGIGRNGRVNDTLKALGLGKIGKTQGHTLNTSIIGMIKKVQHLIVVKEN